MNKLSLLVLVAFVILASSSLYTVCFAQDEGGEGGQTGQTEATGENENTGSSEATETEAPPPEEPAEKPDEEKTYTCPTCGYTLDSPGDCPACNCSLVEKGASSGSDESGTSSDSGSSESADSGSSDSGTSTE